ncbi:hypothetical protein PSAC2689_60367 [Paraburkholderia sacchari]
MFCPKRNSRGRRPIFEGTGGERPWDGPGHAFKWMSRASSFLRPGIHHPHRCPGVVGSCFFLNIEKIQEHMLGFTH